MRRKKLKKKGKRKIGGKKKEIKKKREGCYGHFTFLSTLHSWEKLFCQMFFQNRFNSTAESAPPAQS
jgi:hypothetical protein